MNIFYQKSDVNLPSVITPNFIVGLGISFGLLASYSTKAFSTYAIVLALIFFISLTLPDFALIPFALCLYATSPVVYITSTQIINVLSPIFIALLAFFIRNLRYYSPKRLIVIFIVLISFMQLSFMSINMQRSIGWSINFVLVFALIGQSTLNNEKIWSNTFQVAKRLTYVIAIIGIFEFALKRTLIFGHFGFPNFLNSLWNSDRSWSIYRLTTTLGHPLNNGLFFCTLALTMFIFAYKRKILRNTILPITLAVLLIVLSGSRNSMLAFSIGVTLILLTETDIRAHGQYKRIRNLLLLLLFGSVLIQPALAYISKRNNSSEGSGSFTYRFKLIPTIKELLPNIPATGFGPGSSAETFMAFGQQTILENGAAQLVLSLGLFVALTIIGIFTYLSIKTLIRYPAIFAIALPTISTFISTNFMDANIPYVSFIALVIIMTKVGICATEEFAVNLNSNHLGTASSHPLTPEAYKKVDLT